MKLTAKEEIFFELYRSLEPEQQREFMSVAVKDLRAQIDANRIASKVNSGRKLRVIGNARVEETLGWPRRVPLRKPPKKVVAKPPTKKDDRDDLDPGMDDALG